MEDIPIPPGLELTLQLCKSGSDCHSHPQGRASGTGIWNRHASDTLFVPIPLSPRLSCRPDPSSWQRRSRRWTGLQVWWGLGGLPRCLLGLCAALRARSGGEAVTSNVVTPSSLPFQRAALGILGIPAAWFHKGSQFFIGHLWPLLQVGRELLGALSWLEQNGSASLGSCG